MNQSLDDVSNIRNSYWDYGLSLFDEIQSFVPWENYKILSHQGKFFYVIDLDGKTVCMSYDPALDEVKVTKEENENVEQLPDFKGSKFVNYLKDLFNPPPAEDYKPGETRLDKRQKDAETSKKKIESTKEFANTCTASTGLTGPISNGNMPQPGNAPTFGGQFAGRMSFGPTDKPKKWTGHELNEEIKIKSVIREGKPVTKHVTDEEGYKIQYVDGKPKEVRVKEKETRTRINGQKAGQPIRGAKMDSIQSKRIESLKKK